MALPQKPARPFFSRLSMLFVYIFLAYLIVLLLVRVFESHLIFFPDYPGRLEGNWHPHPLPVEDVWITAADGTKLHAWWIPNPKAMFTFLAFHGNASNIANRAPVYEFLHDTPASVFALEYRGYGYSEGTPSEQGFYRDADAAYEYLVKTKGVAPKSIISFGQSLGTAIAAYAAARHEVGGLVLEAPFPSAARVASKIFWFLPGLSLLVRSQFDTQARLKQINVPVLVVHCAQDPVLPFEFGREVYYAAHSPKDFVQVNGMCHEEGSLVAPSQYRVALRKNFRDQVRAQDGGT